jgi:bifunctional DNA-binding transcriptional regulator/antitoxin component of YhaV-PrlF toxin-antitoxin module
MFQTATITSKRQLTIPVSMYKKMGLKNGQKVVVSYMNNELRVQSALDLVDRLAGSVQIPDKFRGVPIDTIVSRSKTEHFIRHIQQ